MCRQIGVASPPEAGPASCPRETVTEGWEGPGEAPYGLPGVPDLLGLSLAEIRGLDHPVLAEVLVRLRARVGQPAETLWGFSQGPPTEPSPPPPSPSPKHFSPLSD